MIHAVHVYQKGNIPPYTENTERARYVEYGTKFTGVTFKDAFIHDAPVTAFNKKWLEEELHTRIALGGVVRQLGSLSPISTYPDMLGPMHPDHPEHEHTDCCK